MGERASVRVLTGSALEAALDGVARLRIRVFHDWPYLYDGDLVYERRYLRLFRKSKHAIIVGAFVGDTLVGASTGAALSDHAEDFSDAFRNTDIDLNTVFYCAESVLLPPFRGQGLGHQFFDLRESFARQAGFTKVAFCAVQRPEDHPLRPANYSPLDPFWRARGYAPLPGVVAQFRWKDLDQHVPTRKPLQFWIRDL